MDVTYLSEKFGYLTVKFQVVLLVVHIPKQLCSSLDPPHKYGLLVLILRFELPKISIILKFFVSLLTLHSFIMEVS